QNDEVLTFRMTRDSGRFFADAQNDEAVRGDSSLTLRMTRLFKEILR
ncbi:MAG: hypothetical protein HUJ92_03340, partial [Bacteroidales bacterium]|nr:hypothetical protein [Bacteroidales bacterium]